jgi:D-glycero-alpha-D-manno-heptose-7-phosphate kinase
MIISRTPFRISFFGGGTDYPDWYEKNGGAVLSTTINKYSYVSCRHLPPFFDDVKMRVVWSKIELTNHVDEIEHPTAREAMKHLGFRENMEILHNADLPGRSGLGSSSSFTVGLLNALYALQGKMVTKRQLALDAMHIEQTLVGENIGSQDQAAAAFGGFNKITFGGPQKITVEPIIISPGRQHELQDHMMLFFTGFARTAHEIAGEQIKNIPKKSAELNQMMQLVTEAMNILNSEGSVRDFGKLLDEAWQIKRGLSSKVSNDAIDAIYERARKAGALGGKLLGAGSGGFMLIFAEPERQPQVKEALKDLLQVPFSFETLGSQIIYYAPTEHIKSNEQTSSS